ncbi:Hypothetical predicted protein [Paramuricea clavata]|uniref:Uncharacterized protein n=1 Tax=Paramuricea clavata TaxID=317549 RepID=A0A6S7HKS9_PARCT|nr:Hypothetical predicted protein [Paramuricea clavata]
MTIHVSQRIDCLIECDKEPCCRSTNIQKKSSSHDAQICEMLHNVVYNTSEKLLETNPSFDHVYLTSSKKDYNASCLFPKACKDPKALGMQSRKIPDSRIKASSEWTRNWGPRHGRLHGKKCWIAGRSPDTNQWLQIDFKYKATVTEILTQGRPDYNQWVRSYTIAYSDDGVNFTTYKGDKGQDEVFIGNTNRSSVVRQELSPVVVAQFIRIQPKTWKNQIAMRAEVHGCPYPHPNILKTLWLLVACVQT